MKTQIGISAHADFEQNTWTFELADGYSVAAGNFAIIPFEKYNELRNALIMSIGNDKFDKDIIEKLLSEIEWRE